MNMKKKIEFNDVYLEFEEDLVEEKKEEEKEHKMTLEELQKKLDETQSLHL